MARSRVLLACTLWLASLGMPGAAQQPQEQGQAAPQPNDPQATFRAGINFVRVDVIVTDRKDGFVTNLTKDDFEITEDGKPQAVEQFRLIRVDGNPPANAPVPPQIRTREDEELAANREDVRIFAILLDDYHVRKENAMSVREPLTRFIQTQLRPNDLIAVMYPLTPVTAMTFTHDHDSIVRALQQFEGRKFDYTPRNAYEQQYARYPTETVERIRNDVVMGALQGLSVRLGSMREGRKSLIFVSEGFTAMLPPQLRARDAELGVNPIEAGIAARGQDSSAQQSAEWFGQADVYQRMREVYETANRHNTSIYSLDPRGLAPFEYSISDAPGAAMPSFATDRRALQMTQDTLRTLSDETDGRAIVNRNTLAEGLAQIARDSSVYYLLGYNSTQAVNDGKFHEIKVRVKRPSVSVRARKGYWAMTAEDVKKASNPTPDVAKPVQTALASISTAVQAGKYVRTWVGMQRGDNGKTRVTLTWEPLPASPGAARREQPGRVAVLAADARGDLVYRGGSPESAAPVPAAPAATAAAPQRLVFDAPPGKLELRLTVQAAGTGGTLDQEIRALDVPDLTTPQAAISTPRVYRGRTPREIQTYVADANAVPVAVREFSRTERLLIRFDAYATGTEQPEATAVLLNRGGQKMSDVQVTPAQAGGTHQINLGLASVPAGEYLVEITVKSSSGEVKELIPLRVTS
jgi:VWFA-related protein